MMQSLRTGWQGLLRSRKFWVAVLDLVVSLVLYFSAKYLSPNTAEDVKFLLALVQPVVLLVIIAWTVEDAVAKWRACS